MIFSRVYKLIRSEYRWLKKVVHYAIFLRNDVDYDYTSILTLLQFKIGRTRVSLHTSSFGDSEKSVRELFIAEIMLEELIDDNFAARLYDAHDEKWGTLQVKSMDNYVTMARPGVKSNIDKLQEQVEYKNIIDQEVKARERAYRKTFEYILIHIRNWWD